MWCVSAGGERSVGLPTDASPTPGLTAKKYHVEHFTCSVCPVVFGPSDSYYEHDGEVCA